MRRIRRRPESSRRTRWGHSTKMAYGSPVRTISLHALNPSSSDWTSPPWVKRNRTKSGVLESSASHSPVLSSLWSATFGTPRSPPLDTVIVDHLSLPSLLNVGKSSRSLNARNLVPVRTLYHAALPSPRGLAIRTSEKNTGSPLVSVRSTSVPVTAGTFHRFGPCCVRSPNRCRACRLEVVERLSSRTFPPTRMSCRCTISSASSGRTSGTICSSRCSCSSIRDSPSPCSGSSSISRMSSTRA